MQIVLTGASSGIGYHTAMAFLKNEKNSVYVISRNREKLSALQSESNRVNSPGKLILFPGDLNSVEDCERIKNGILTYTSSLDILINNAGLLINKPFEKLDQKDWELLYATNVFAVVSLTQKLLPLLSEASIKPSGFRSHILNIGSIGGLNGTSKFSGLSAYSSSKGALAILTECLAEEFKERKIAVNGLALGSVETEMFKKAFPGLKASGTPEDMADYIAEFAMTGPMYYNGKNLSVSKSTP